MNDRHDPLTDSINSFLDDLVAGKTPPNADPAVDPDLASLQSSASQFHRLVRAGEAHAATSPSRRSWDAVAAKSRSLGIDQLEPGISPGSTSGRSIPLETRFVATIRRWQPAISMAIVVALLASVIALTYHRGVLENPEGAGTFGAMIQDQTPGFLQPVAATDCDKVDPRPAHELAAMRLGPPPNRTEPFLPVSPSPVGLAEDIARSGRRYLACELANNALVSSALETEAYIASPPRNMIHDVDAHVARQEHTRALSEKVVSGNLADYWMRTDTVPPLDPYNASRDNHGDNALKTFIPGQVMQLADGRVGAPLVTLLHPNVTVTMPESGLVHVPFYVFAEAPGESGFWLLDEVVTLCLGECDRYWASPGDYPAGSPLSSPVLMMDGIELAATTPHVELSPTPVATPLADLFPVAVIADCTVDSRPLESIRALQEEPGEQAPRAYVPVEPADPVLAGEIVDTALTWRSCSGWGKPSQRMVLESPWLIASWDSENTPTLAEQERLQNEQNEFAAALPREDWTRWFVETATLGEYTPGTAIHTPEDHRSFILPGDVFLLPDGRAAGIVTKLVPVGYHTSMATSPDHAMEVQIFVQDPTQNGRWVLDEMLWLEAPDAPPIPAWTATRAIHNRPLHW